MQTKLHSFLEIVFMKVKDSNRNQQNNLPLSLCSTGKSFNFSLASNRNIAKNRSTSSVNGFLQGSRDELRIALISLKVSKTRNRTRTANRRILVYLYQFQALNHPISHYFQSATETKTALHVSRAVLSLARHRLATMNLAGLELS